MSKKMMRLLAVLFALALFATACGSDSVTDAVGDAVDAAGDAASDAADAATDAASDAADAVEDAVDGDDDEAMADDAMDDDDGEDAGGAVDEDAAADAMEDTTEVVDGGAVDAGSIDALEAEWAEERQAIIDDIVAQGYGRDGDIVTGPAGMTIDLSNCPADWDDTAGVEGGVITVGHTIAQSGALAAYGNIAGGMTAIFNYYNENGGFGPDRLTVNHVVKDDAYVATQTQELVDELLQSENPFYVTTLGSPNTFSVRGVLNEACVPQTFVQTGHQAWGDPEGNPWTTGLQMSYATEALLWGTWIEQNTEPGATVAALVMDNDFGLAYEQGFAEFAEASDHIGEVTFVRHDPAAATLTNEMTTLASSVPDVFISMTAGNACLLAVQEAGNTGVLDVAQAAFMPSVCKSIQAYMLPAGDVSDGWYIFGGGVKDNADPQYADDTFVQFLNEQLEAAGIDPSISLAGSGFGQYGWAHVQSLKIAAELPGGLTRSNFMIAQRSLDMNHPLFLEGVEFEMDGNADAYLTEGSDLSQFSFADESWNIVGGIIDLNGESSNCAWVPGEGC